MIIKKFQIGWKINFLILFLTTERHIQLSYPLLFKSSPLPSSLDVDATEGHKAQRHQSHCDKGYSQPLQPIRHITVF